MRYLVVLLFAAGLAHPHGESARSAPPGGVGPVVVPTGGPTSGGNGGPASAPTTIASGGARHAWTTWWAYNREWILAARARGTPLSGGLRGRPNDELSRKRLREGELLDLMVVALGDKHQQVRSAAAIALGKFGMPEADRYLTKRIHFPPEGWYTVREACIYGMGQLGLPENRKLLETIAGHKERSIKERSLALTGLLMDGTQESADTLVWHLKFFRKSVKSTSGTPPVRSEQDRRRMAAHLLGFVGLDGYDDLLSAVAQGSRRWDDGVAGLAITALGRRRATEHKEQLFRMFFRRELDVNVRRSIPIALGMMIDRDDTDDIRRLARFIRDFKRDVVTQHFTVLALAHIGGDAVVDILADLLRNKVFADKNDRAFAHLALGRVGARSERAREILMAQYHTRKTHEEQAVLAVALGLARHKEAVPLTIERLERSAPAFLAWGTLALGLHGDERGVPVVRKIFRKHHDARVRESAAIALTLLRKRAAVPELLEILKNAGTMHARAAVVTALGIQPEPTREMVDALIDVYRDDSVRNDVRAMAVIALGALADPRIVPFSAQLTRDYNYFIRCLGLDQIASFL